jgi:hypothetical protein
MTWRSGGITRCIDSIPVWANDPIGIQQYRERLRGIVARLEYDNRNLGLTRDVLEQGKYFADGHFTSIRTGVVQTIE